LWHLVFELTPGRRRFDACPSNVTAHELRRASNAYRFYPRVPVWSRAGRDFVAMMGAESPLSANTHNLPSM
jgi:hypothetical protein